MFESFLSNRFVLHHHTPHLHVHVLVKRLAKWVQARLKITVHTVYTRFVCSAHTITSRRQPSLSTGFVTFFSNLQISLQFNRSVGLILFRWWPTPSKNKSGYKERRGKPKNKWMAKRCISLYLYYRFVQFVHKMPMKVKQYKGWQLLPEAGIS